MEPSNDHLRSAQRVLVYGVAGAGKTFTAARISEALSLPLHKVDEEIGWLSASVHGPWQLRPQPEIRHKFSQLAQTERWILDGAYESSIPDVTRRSDVIICLDYPRWLILYRITKRTLLRVIRREDICNGNRETLRNVLSRQSPIIYVMRKFQGQRDLMRSWAGSPDLNTIVLRQPRSLARLLESLH